ncbi:MAG: hypothetical protein NUV54_03630 [Candidatus Taylorbacteria bacterium]|nr:hypothetical protein [Candidatus Taylorbacteria bacterium]
MGEKVTRKVKRIYSPLKRKIILLLEAGVALSFAGTVGRQLRILNEAAKEWKGIDAQYLKQVIREFYADRLVSEKENGDGTVSIVLTEKGKERALTFNIDTLEVPSRGVWDGKWHGVLFDIPEKQKLKRHAFRSKLQDLGFLQWQKSVFVYPHPCRDQIDFIVEFFELRPHVRYCVLTDITNEAELILHFGLKKSKNLA